MRLLYLIYLSFILINLAYDGRAQSEKDYASSLSLGINLLNDTKQDLLASPFYYKKTMASADLTFQRLTYKSYQSGYLNFRNPILESDHTGLLGSDSHTAESGTLYFYYHNLFKVKKLSSDRLSTYFGPGINLIFNIANYNYGRGIANETIAEISTSLNATTFFNYKLTEKIEVSYEGSIALLQYSFRNPYSLTTDELAAEATKKSLFGAYLSLGKWYLIDYPWLSSSTFRAQLISSKHLTLGVTYRFEYRNFIEPRKSVTLTNSFGLSIIYQFGRS